VRAQAKMPIYEYECPKCGAFERLQGINDSPLARCPTCRSKVSKLISSSSFQLKGDGWYADGYSGKKPSKPITEASSKPKAVENNKKPASTSKPAKTGGSTD